MLTNFSYILSLSNNVLTFNDNKWDFTNGEIYIYGLGVNYEDGSGNGRGWSSINIFVPLGMGNVNGTG